MTWQVRLEEAKRINKSIAALGNCIAALAEQAAALFRRAVRPIPQATARHLPSARPALPRRASQLNNRHALL